MSCNFKQNSTCTSGSSPISAPPLRVFRVLSLPTAQPPPPPRSSTCQDWPLHCLRHHSNNSNNLPSWPRAPSPARSAACAAPTRPPMPPTRTTIACGGRGCSSARGVTASTRRPASSTDIPATADHQDPGQNCTGVRSAMSAGGSTRRKLRISLEVTRWKERAR